MFITLYEFFCQEGIPPLCECKYEIYVKLIRFHSSNFPLFPPYPFCCKLSQKSGVVSIETLMHHSYGVPEGRPQCKSFPLRKEIRDVALKESRTVCVSEKERKRQTDRRTSARERGEFCTRLPCMHMCWCKCVCVYVCLCICVCGPLSEVENYF